MDVLSRCGEELERLRQREDALLAQITELIKTNYALEQLMAGMIDDDDNPATGEEQS